MRKESTRCPIACLWWCRNRKKITSSSSIAWQAATSCALPNISETSSPTSLCLPLAQTALGSWLSCATSWCLCGRGLWPSTRCCPLPSPRLTNSWPCFCSPRTYRRRDALLSSGTPQRLSIRYQQLDFFFLRDFIFKNKFYLIGFNFNWISHWTLNFLFPVS